ncbi:hypothetical protein [Phycicoccus avicenniae]|uniref:hypothetical protein n=1 Tax=Phycicoccus avicenniae TaxID=2828860 RepID=UPI003D27419F
MTDTQPEVTDQVEVYDPSAHTVPQVLEHLETQHPDERARILAAEEAGKARTTILDSTVAAEAEEVEPASVEEQLGADDPYELVRARTAGDSPVEYTTTRVAALNAGSTVLDKPAADQFGVSYPTKTVLDLSAEATPTDAEADSQPGTDSEEI